LVPLRIYLCLTEMCIRGVISILPARTMFL